MELEPTVDSAWSSVQTSEETEQESFLYARRRITRNDECVCEKQSAAAK